MCRNLCKACRLVRTWKLHSTSICSGSTWTPATNTCPTNFRDVLNSLLFFMFTEASTLALVENSLDIIEILFQLLGDNYDVIQRIQSWWHLSIPLVLSHEPLKCCKSILQSKQHDFELEQTKRAKKKAMISHTSRSISICQYKRQQHLRDYPVSLGLWEWGMYLWVCFHSLFWNSHRAVVCPLSWESGLLEKRKQNKGFNKVILQHVINEFLPSSADRKWLSEEDLMLL